MSLDMDLGSIDSREPVAHVSTSPATGDLYVQPNDIGADKDEVQSTRQTENIPSGGQDSGKRDEQSTRPKRISKPTAKIIENRFLSDRPKLERLWERTMAATAELQETPDVVGELRSAIAKVRFVFNEYHVVWLSLMDFTVHASTPECCDERRALDEVMKTRKDFVQAAINEGIERKNDLLQENASARSGSRDSTFSSTSMRAKAKANAAAALKKAEWQKRKSQVESESALLMEREEKKKKEEELAFARKKREQEARMENLRLEMEAAVALARANAIDEELGLRSEIQNLPELPLLDPAQRVQEFVNTQPCDQHIPDQDQQPRSSFKRDEYSSSLFPGGHEYPPHQSPKPERKVFSTSPIHNTSSTDQHAMESYVQFMARQELIANEIEKFDDRPENFHTWKAAFQNMIRNINIIPSEELSLLIEYTSKESKKLVQRLRNAFIANPKGGVEESWKKLAERFGSSAVMTQVHLNKLKTFPKIGYKDNKQLQELGDLLLELQCAKEDGGLAGLRILDEPAFLRPIMTKLPEDIQNRWQKQAFRYKTQYSVDYPPFAEFSKFIQDLSRERNDPYLIMETPERKFSGSAWAHPKPFRSLNQGPGFTVNKTAMSDPRPRPSVTLDPSNWCVMHRKTHPLQKCRVFRMKPLAERKQLLAHHKICFRCVATCAHLAKNCTAQIKCTECQSEGHVSALHPDPTGDTAALRREHYNPGQPGVQNHGEEPYNITASCTEVCGDSVSSKSCSKICLASIYINGHPDMKIRAYAVIDDQNNCSLAKPELFELLELKGEATPNTLKTWAGTSQARGRRAEGLVIESLDGIKRHSLPVLTECDAIPDEREEIPTPGVARHHAHLRPIADQIPELDPDAKILLLIGRDAPQLHKVHESRNGPRKAPWAQRLDLGWVVLGNVCLDGAHKPPVAHVYRTQILYNGRPSRLQPCPNHFHIKHEVGSEVAANQPRSAKHGSFLAGKFDDGLGMKVFHCTKDDNRLGPSIEDKRFLNIMDKGVNQSEEGNWVAPLPFRRATEHVPNNRQDALKRFKSTQRSLDRKPLMKEHYFAFMQNLFDRGHAEPVPPANPEDTGACWYLPHFGVYHPQKPGKIRVVFDSAAETDGVSLNKLLLPGPHLTNSLLGVLLRFRQNPVAFMADVEQMFHSFVVEESHRDFLRFFWYKDNNPSGELTEYRMKVHVFGNTSSPAVASFCLKRTAEVGEAKFGSDARNFVERNFYVDDGLKSVAKPTEAIDLLRRTQGMLATANLRLHKIASNHIDVTQAFPSEDQASDLRDLDLSRDIAPIQRSLGVFWDIGTDTFTFRVAIENKPFTRRGVLSVINGLYDPLGIAAPVIIKGKFLLKAMTSHLCNLEPGDWDKPLPDCHKLAWENWCRTLLALREVKVPRSYVTLPIEEANRREIHTFCDASNEAIGAVSYLKTVHPDGRVEVSFLLGKAKLAPSRATTIPRLELCAAVLGVELTDLVMEELDVDLEAATYYSDSKVVLGYITNESRRFYIYVSNRVEQIRKSSSPSQWHYVPTHLNPADLATRSVHAHKLDGSSWLNGPQFLHAAHPATDTPMGSLTAETANDDPEVRPEVTVQAFMTNKQTSRPLGSERFSRFSRWTTLIRAIAKLILIVRSFSQRTRVQQNPPTHQSTSLDVKILTQAKTTVLKTVQYESFATDIDHLSNGERLPKTSALIKLSPTIDSDGLLRLGGRLEQANLNYEECHPLILPGSNHVSTLIVQHFHAKDQHQGRHFTLGSIRSSGFWIIGGKGLVNKVLDKCIKGKKLRGRQQQQKMADLHTDRLTPAPPFSFVGLFLDLGQYLPALPEEDTPTANAGPCCSPVSQSEPFTLK